MAPIAQIVDVGDLLRVTWAAFAAGVGIAVVFSVVILGFARAIDMRSEGRTGAMLGYLVLMVVALAVVLAAVGLGLAVMVSE